MFKCSRDNGLAPVYPVTTDPAILKSVQDKPVKQGIKKTIILSFSQPEILVAIATKEKSYMIASITLVFRLLKDYFYFYFTTAGVVPCGGRKMSPRTSLVVQIILHFSPL